MKWKENFPLYVGIAIPILMVLFVVGSIYIPRVFSNVKPQYDFLYMVGPRSQVNLDYSAESSYSVEGGHLNKVTRSLGPGVIKKYQTAGVPPKPKETRFYRYDVSANAVKKLSFAEAHQLTISAKKKSPDEFEIVTGGGGNFFPFGVSNEQERLLVGPHSREVLHINYDIDSGFYGFQFLGWIVNNGATK